MHSMQMGPRGPYPPNRPPPPLYRRDDDVPIIPDNTPQIPRPKNKLLDGLQIRELQSHKKRVQVVAWSCDGRTLASASADGVIKGWTVEPVVSSKTEQPDWSYEAASTSRPDRIECLAWHSKDAAWLTVATNSGIQQFDGRAGKPTQCVNGLHGVVHLDWHPDGRSLAARDSRGIAVYDIRKMGDRRGKLANECNFDSNASPGQFMWARNGKSLVCAYGNPDRHGGFLVLQYPSFSVESENVGHVEPCTSVAVSADASYVATGGNDALVTLWDTSAMAAVKTFLGSDGPVTSLSFSHDGRFLAFNCVSDGKASVDVAMVDGSHPVHRFSTDPKFSKSGMALTCNVDCLTWNPKYAVLAFCGDMRESRTGFTDSPIAIVAPPVGHVLT